MAAVVFSGGTWVERHAVALVDPGYLLGDGVFATMHAYAGRCFRAERHLAELERGARLAGIPLPASRGAILEEAARRSAGMAHANVRVTLTRGVDEPTLSILVRPMELPPDDDYAHGIAAVTVSLRRIPPECLDPTVKTTSYAAQLAARREATARGAQEAIQLTIDGALAGGAMANLFVVRGNDLLTPSAVSGCRLGVTRGAVLELATAVGLTPIERRLEPSILEGADEAFLTNTRIECLPIASVDGRRIATTFPKTRAIREALQREIAR